MLEQLRFHGLRYRLGLATCSELRHIADAALYDLLFERPQEITYRELAGEAACLELNADVINTCKIWLNKHAV